MGTFTKTFSASALFFLSTSTLTPAFAVDEFVVTTTRRAVSLENVGSSISVLSEIELERGQFNFALDALETLPGLSINQNGSYGGVATVRIRGALTDQTVILIDGVQVNDSSATGGGYNFANLNPHDIARVEVLKGPQSVLYGSDAIGGVVNIITKSGGDGFEGSAFAEVGSYNTYRAGVTLRGGNERFDYRVTGTGVTSGGISKAEKDNGNGENDGYENYAVSAKIGAMLSDIVRAEFIGRYSDSDIDSDGFDFLTFLPTDTSERDTSEELVLAGRLFVDLLDGRFENTFSVEFSDIDRAHIGPVSFFGKGERLNFDYLGNFTVNDQWRVTGGLQHEEVKAKTDEIASEEVTIDSVFADVEWTPIENLILTGGLRYDDHETFGDVTTGRITAAYNIPETGTRFHASWGEGFKAPSLYQLTYICTFCGLTTPASDLDPEESKAWDIGVSQRFFDDRVTVGATYFNQEGTDIIDFDFLLGYINVAEVESQGVEFEVRADISDAVSINGHYVYTDAEDATTGEQLARQPEHEAFLSLNWDITEQLATSLDVTYHGEQMDSPFATTDEWTRVDLKASYDLHDQVQLYGRVDNLFDEDYQHVLNYGTPGRSAFLGMRGTF